MRLKEKDILKANRKGNRDAELENSNGWKVSNKVHKSQKHYSRKNKHKSETFFV